MQTTPLVAPASAPSVRPVLLDVQEAAAHLGTPVRFIRRLVAERRIRFYKVGRYVRIDRRDLDAVLNDGCVEPWSTLAGRH